MPAGRPCLLTEELAAALIEDRKGPLPDADVALKNGVSGKSVSNWIQRGLAEDAQEPFRSFAEGWCRAKLNRKMELLQVIENASKVHDASNWKQRGDYKSAIFLLEHMWPKHYGPRALEHGQEGDINIDDLVNELESEVGDLEALLLSPPPQLLEAMVKCAPQLRALLHELAPLKELEAADDSASGSSQ